MQKIYLAQIFNPLENKTFEYFKTGALVTEGEKILFCGDSEHALKTFPNAEIYDFKNEIIIPGLIDTHVHLPQFQATALGKGELLDWLQNYIFPLEARFKADDFAREQSQLFFKELARNGTTTAAVYSTSHLSATDIAFKSALDSGLRISMGNSVMERNSIPELDLSAEENLHNCETLAAKWHNADNGRLRYVVTPRFAGSCSLDLLKKLGQFARINDLPIQTHLSENLKEIEFILQQFPDFKTYTEIYEKTGLLKDKTILAHSIYLNQSEENTLKTHNCAIAHCPTSNRFLSSGIMPLKKYLAQSFKIGLGSDVAGGFSLSILHEASEAIESSKFYKLFKNAEEEILSVAESFYLATLGGAQAMNLKNVAGNFKSGKEADFVIVQTEKLSSPEAIFKNGEEILARIIYTASRDAVLKTFVRGKCVFEQG